MKRIGITGANGFMGINLRNYFKCHYPETEIVSISRESFKNKDQIRAFVLKCDAIVHLAGLNRGLDDEVYKTNIGLADDLISACSAQKKYPYIVFASSPHESRQTGYGRSKKEARIKFSEMAKQNNSGFSGLIIPNTFGPFGRPFHNSVISTFCHQVVIGQEPVVDVDASLGFVYMDTVSKCIAQSIDERRNAPEIAIKSDFQVQISQIRNLLLEFKTKYSGAGIVPLFADDFALRLFNTFRTFIPASHYPFKLERKEDARGYLVETIKSFMGGQCFFSMTHPGITRGNHYHTRKFERFCVLQGEGLIRLRRIDQAVSIDYKVSGNEPSVVDMPIWHTHNITNTGTTPMLTLFWSNEIFNPNDPDTFMEAV
ncbi:MAG: hypothetical protein A2268_15020 [Candidatus Raymondbacteria bacterium RifOxyA12_full_50_37]|nr:MAG: hypothetical protein A2268_15020 [Candidatus Raymondbacteria bacterium RifOxyA12_full_50_37]OGJ88528.1 MAG: hypothetical protein A2248_20240 [Candidatus Raymondbacteria bacterium RIFOXYA2_FULL_49_16]OGJ98989.1 MAG: hypothetical protein A2453_10960 [Candidatus Raymondbacteria bacterium RIFOXYC2_FULL_50_21]OGK00625.1 MAG: hypothetical protein A2487_13805 [Candidatus Raymondbacteria bacterium RifOxyC12_full_50_8]OGP41499.1 MAG: hypothetical protein A2324_05770 [Candidatus Raymondbacteria b